MKVSWYTCLTQVAASSHGVDKDFSYSLFLAWGWRSNCCTMPELSPLFLTLPLDLPIQDSKKSAVAFSEELLVLVPSSLCLCRWLEHNVVWQQICLSAAPKCTMEGKFFLFFLWGVGVSCSRFSSRDPVFSLWDVEYLLKSYHPH